MRVIIHFVSEKQKKWKCVELWVAIAQLKALLAVMLIGARMMLIDIMH